jgi:hypothetical protein
MIPRYVWAPVATTIGIISIAFAMKFFGLIDDVRWLTGMAFVQGGISCWLIRQGFDIRDYNRD